MASPVRGTSTDMTVVNTTMIHFYKYVCQGTERVQLQIQIAMPSVRTPRNYISTLSDKLHQLEHKVTKLINSYEDNAWRKQASHHNVPRRFVNFPPLMDLFDVRKTRELIKNFRMFSNGSKSDNVELQETRAVTNLPFESDILGVDQVQYIGQLREVYGTMSAASLIMEFILNLEEKIDLKNQQLPDRKSLMYAIYDMKNNLVDWVLCKCKQELVRCNQMDVFEFHIDPKELIPVNFWRESRSKAALMRKSFALISAFYKVLSSLSLDMQKWLEKNERMNYDPV